MKTRYKIALVIIAVLLAGWLGTILGYNSGRIRGNGDYYEGYGDGYNAGYEASHQDNEGWDMLMEMVENADYVDISFEGSTKGDSYYKAIIEIFYHAGD